MEDGDRSAGGGRTPRRVGARVVLVLVLMLGCLALLVANVTVWLRVTALDTDRFVAALAPLAQDRELDDALAVELTDRILDEVDVKARVESALSDETP